MPLPLEDISVVTLAPNVPGPVAAARLRDLGAQVTKVESPAGDPLRGGAPAWYAALHAGMRTETLDLKTDAGRAAFAALLTHADVLLTSSRLSALDRLGLAWDTLHASYPRLIHIAIVGRMPPEDGDPGHDLNYVGELGLLEPPSMPRTLIADLAGAERAVCATLALLFARERTGESAQQCVALREAAVTFSLPLVHGLTTSGAWLSGGFPAYGLYRAADGWIASGCLEPHFVRTLTEHVGNGSADRATLEAAFATRTVSEWLTFAMEHDLPISRVT